MGDHDGPAVGLACCGADITVELARGHRRHRHHLRSFVGTYLLYAAQLWPATTRGDPARRVGNLTTWCHTLKRNSTAFSNRITYDRHMTTAALYLRISRDLTGEQLGVDRQRDAAEEYARASGYEVAEVFTDNDISAAGGKRRPGFEALLATLAAGHLSVVIAWNWDRLTRNRPDTVQLIETCQRAKAKVALVRGSDLDMSTPSGRMTAGILAEVA